MGFSRLIIKLLAYLFIAFIRHHGVNTQPGGPRMPMQCPTGRSASMMYGSANVRWGEYPDTNFVACRVVDKCN